MSLRLGKFREFDSRGAVEHEERFGWIEMNVSSIPDFTVSKVHEVFGERSSNEIDHGIATDGVTYEPTRKGTVKYPFYDDVTATPQPPYSLKYMEKEVSFNIKFDTPAESNAVPRHLWRILEKNEVDSLRIVIWEK